MSIESARGLVAALLSVDATPAQVRFVGELLRGRIRIQSAGLVGLEWCAMCSGLSESYLASCIATPYESVVAVVDGSVVYAGGEAAADRGIIAGATLAELAVALQAPELPHQVEAVRGGAAMAHQTGRERRKLYPLTEGDQVLGVLVVSTFLAPSS